MKPHKAYPQPKQKQPLSLILELEYNKNLGDFSKSIEGFKELRLNQREKLIKNEDDENNILYYEDSELKDLMNNKEFPEKEFNIVNHFIQVEEEENLIRKENLKKKNNYTNYDNGADDDSKVLRELNHKLLLDEEFQPGIFSSFDFNDNIKSLVFNSLTNNNNNSKFDFNYKNIKSNNFSGSFSEEVNNIPKGMGNSDGLILDLCLKDKNMESDDIVINFNDEIKEEEKKGGSVIDEEKTDYEGFSKLEAIPEYEHQILCFQDYYQVEHTEDYSNHPKIEEDAFDKKLLDYLANVCKIIKDKELKNKIKLIIKLIFYKDEKSKKYVFNNKEKNELLLYWKNSYIKELEDATYNEKNKILQKKLESYDPNNKIIEFTMKKNKDRKSHGRKRSISMYNKIMGNSKNGSSINSGIKKISFKNNHRASFTKKK